MNKYELMVILKPDIGGDATTKRLNEVRKLITSQKGELFFEDLWGLRDLSYRMKGHDRGYYAVLNFNLDPEEGTLQEIDTTCRLENEILRHMIVKLPGTYEPKSFARVEEEEEKPAPTKAAAKKPAMKAAVKKEEQPEEEMKKEAPKKAEKAEKPEAEESKEPSLEDVDAKLKSIIENPDLNF